MKKIIALTMFICLLFTSCDLEIKGDDRLVGTCYYTQDINYETEHGGYCNEVYEFTSDNEVLCYTTKDGLIVAEYGTYRYKLNYPYLTITTNKAEVRKYTFVDTRTFILDGVNEDDYYATYYLER